MTAPSEAYLHRYFVRKHFLSLLTQLREKGTPEVWLDLPLGTWRQWMPDQHGALSTLPDCLTARQLQEKLGLPAELASCFACLFARVRPMGSEASALWTEPRHRGAMLEARDGDG